MNRYDLRDKHDALLKEIFELETAIKSAPDIDKKILQEKIVALQAEITEVRHELFYL
ncbi:hypothetical protein BH11BAC6_BH11BAC6_17140 [soil metagenome]